MGVPYSRVLIIRILLVRVLYLGPLFSETPIYTSRTAEAGQAQYPFTTVYIGFGGGFIRLSVWLKV